MTRYFARFGLSSACLALGFLTATACAASDGYSAPSARMVAQADNSSASSADSSLPTTEQPAPADEGTRSVEALPPDSPAPTRRSASSTAPNSAPSAEQAARQPMQESLECEPSPGEQFQPKWSWHPFATWQANMAAAHCAPVLFPHYDGEPRTAWVPGAQMASYIQGSDGSTEVVEQGSQSAAVEQSAQPLGGEGAASGDGSCQPEMPMNACCNGDSCGWFGGSDYYLIRPHQTHLRHRVSTDTQRGIGR